jgi:hypothetical protein
VRYLPQEPDFAGAPTTLAYVEAGLGPGDDPLKSIEATDDVRALRRQFRDDAATSSGRSWSLRALS